MKVIHTFSAGSGGGTIPFTLMANTYLSAKYAKSLFDRVELYINLPGYRSLINCFGDDLPYDDIIILEDTEEKIKTWSVPKIQVYEMQTEPYLHIDLDTVMYRRFNFEGRKCPVLFSHQDMFVPNPPATYQEAFNDILIQGEVDIPGTPGGLYQTYLKFLFRTVDHYTPLEFKSFDCLNIPNMNIVYVEDPNLMSKASTRALEVYHKYKDLFDSNPQAPCYIEQFLLHWFLRVYSPEYKEASDRNLHTVLPQDPLMVNCIGNNLVSYSYLDINFSTLEGKLIYKEVQEEEDIRRFITSKLGGFFHSTAYKHKPIVEANILYALQEIAGEEVLQKLHRFHLMHRFNNGKPYLSEGQKLYEQYIKPDFFDLDVTEFIAAEKNLNIKLI